jgi:hypothetical protein
MPPKTSAAAPPPKADDSWFGSFTAMFTSTPEPEPAVPGTAAPLPKSSSAAGIANAGSGGAAQPPTSTSPPPPSSLKAARRSSQPPPLHANAVAAAPAVGAMAAASRATDGDKPGKPPSERKQKTYGKALCRWMCCCGHRCYLFSWPDCCAWFFTGGIFGCCSCWELFKLRELTMAANTQVAKHNVKKGASDAVVSEKSCCIAACLCICQAHRAYLYGFTDCIAYWSTCGCVRRCCSCCELCSMRELTMAAASVKTPKPTKMDK